jgi:pimeloyl-ACP methyl ester carboxylesterase
MLIISAVIVVGIVLIIGILLISSPGSSEPILDEEGKILAGSISEKTFVEINGVDQGMFIKSRNAENPVLLYLHGGMPEYFLTSKYPVVLEDYFTVVWWEQRGSGISYNEDIPQETINLEQFISDTIEMTNYLRDRFGKEKIYLMGHSGGTFIGIQAAAKAPELYYAYIAMAQMTYQLESEKLAYDYMLQTTSDTGNGKLKRKLEENPVTIENGIPESYNAIRDVAMHSLGIGTTHQMKSVISGIFIPSLMNREYTFMEKINMWRGKSKSGISSLWNEMMEIDLRTQILSLEIPVYFLNGRYDYTVSSNMAKEYFDELQAPIKGFYWFERSAHSPLFEEPEKVRTIIREDILSSKNDLADNK